MSNASASEGLRKGQPSEKVDNPSSTTPPGIDAKATKSSRRLPSWLDHFNPRDLKVLFRCWVAAWVAVLLIFIGPTLRTIGVDTFFAAVVILIVPPSGILFIFTLGALTILIGMCLAWGWGVIVMKAALAARPAAETQARLQALEEEAYKQARITGLSVANEAQVLEDNGFMLDTSVTVVYFVLICLFIYILARLRAKNPKFTLVQVYGTIVSDVFLTIGPLRPSFDGTLPVTLIKPGAIGVGLGFVCSILFFPQSTSHTVLAAMEGLLSLAKYPLNSTGSYLKKDSEPPVLKDLLRVKAKTIAAYRAMEPAIAFLPLDFSRSRWNADDVKSLREPVRQTMLSSLSLLELHIGSVRGWNKFIKEFRPPSYEEVTSDLATKQKPPYEPGHQQLMQSAELIQDLRNTESDASLSETVEELHQSTAEILPVCVDTITTVIESIHTVNFSRWFNTPTKEKFDQLLHQSRDRLVALRSVRRSFGAKATERPLQSHEDACDNRGRLKHVSNLTIHPLREITISMVYEEQILDLADSLERLLERIIQLSQARTKNKTWFPSGIRYAAAWVFKTKIAAPIADQSADVDPDVVDEQSKEAQRRLRISRGVGGKHRKGIGKLILSAYEWVINPEGLYALRMVVITIAFAIPAVIPSSAGFYFREKCIWGLIIGQSTILVYMADFIFSLMTQAIGTVVGGVLGLVAWYIGSGNGPGNPYGLAAIMAAVVAILMWARLFSNPAFLQAIVIGGATCMLIIGYSFSYSHIPQYGDPGIGYTVFWHRLVLVIIGLAGALVVQLFPRPPSASRHICKSLSNGIRTLSDHYALLLSCWGQSNSKVGLVSQQISIKVAAMFASLDRPIALLRLEFSSSPFDSETLSQVKSLSQDINQALCRLLYLSASLPMELQERHTLTLGVLDHHNIGDIMAVLSVVEQSLRTGNALPEVLPNPLLRRCYEYRRDANLDIMLSKEMIRDENHRKFCLAVNAYLKFLSALDDLVLVLKRTLGESHIISKELLEAV